VSTSRATAQADGSRRWAILPEYGKLELAYEYTVGAQRCVGSRYDALAEFPTAQRTAAILRALPKGAAVAVRYAPDAPCRALLIPGVGVYGILMLAMTLGFTLLFGVPALRKLRRLRTASAKPRRTRKAGRA